MRELTPILSRASLSAVEVALRYANGAANDNELASAWETASSIARELWRVGPREPIYFAAEAAAMTTLEDAIQAKISVIDFTASALAARRAAGRSIREFEKTRQQETDRLRTLQL